MIRTNYLIVGTNYLIVAYREECEGLKPPLESFSRIDHAVIVMSNNY